MTLANRQSTNAVIQRVHRVWDVILESTRLREITSHVRPERAGVF